MRYRVGTRLYSATSRVEVIVTRAPADDLVIACHGAPMLESESDRRPDDATPDVTVGKRFEDARRGLEVLCVVAGAGPLTVDGSELDMRVAKALPSSD